MKALYTKYHSHYRENLRLAIPLVISRTGNILTQVSDSVVIGHFGGIIPLAGVSLGNSLFIIPLMMGLGVCYGITPLIAQYSGAGRKDKCGKLLINSLLLNTAAGIILFTVVCAGVVLTLPYLGQSPEVIKQARPFLFIMGVSLIPFMIFNTFKQFAEGLGFTKQAMKISIWGSILNIVLGIIFVKGLFGIPPMGIRGTGYSTLIERALMAVFMVFYVFRSTHFKEYLTKFLWRHIDRRSFHALLRIGLPVSMQQLFAVSAFAGAGILVGAISPVAQAAHQVAMNMASLTYIMASGVAAAAAIKSGNHFGAGNADLLQRSAISTYHIVIIFMSFTAIIFASFNHLLPLMYTSDQAVVSLAAQLFIIAAIFQLFDGLQVVGLGILRGMGDVNIPTFINFLAYWIFGIPIGFVLGIVFHWGAQGVWCGLTLSLMTASLLLFLRFKRISMKILKVTY
ncbi:MATE family efflux transporter [Parapedobacter koreensis]|uniref:Multidrug-efflux transporter n=1 Tax=Parapedobacter koreensis TaxID=332977 RepID=A0A1H7SJR8_9SPHI|nr:MATE family efflux transporter [Parapedobacter koreensis]SEL72708.1 multidrug resistance protein, MATE family [Parapedobacter koreensis]